MKHLLKTALGLVFCLTAVTSCSDDETPAGNGGFGIDKTELAAAAEGGQETVTITAGGEWTASVSEPWLNISPANGDGDAECVVTIDAALKNEVRTANIMFRPKGQEPQKISVTQLGYGKMVYVKETEVSLKASDDYEKRFFEAEVTTNIPFNVEMEYLTEKEGTLLKDWLYFDKKKLTFDLVNARPKTFNIRFDWSMNPEWIKREANIKFVPNESDADAETTPIHVVQDASPVITDDRAGDSLVILTMIERLNSDSGINPSENMSYWENVELWKRTDKDLPHKDAVGRVKALSITMVDTKESLPQEVKYLKYMETFQVYGNVNTMLLSIDLGSEICYLEHLKHLQIGGYGLVSLPKDFKELGDKLETLDLSANNFKEFPSVLNPTDFYKLKSLTFTGNRRWTVNDLQNPGNYKKEELGLWIDLNTSNAIDQVFLWENLEELVLSYNYLEGSLPTYEGMPGYTQADIAERGDTLKYLINEGKHIPKILPKMKRLCLNLNFLTGDLPDWLKYHPNLLDWFPETLIFNQQEKGKDSQGRAVKFDNAHTNFDYYFKAYPLYSGKYEMEGDEEQGQDNQEGNEGSEVKEKKQ